MKNGIPQYNEDTKTYDKKLIGGYCFKGNTFDIFQNFFGSTNPYTDFFVNHGEEAPVKEEKPEGAPEDIEIVLSCTIFEFYNGSLKTFTFNRDKLQPDGRSIDQEESQMTIEVKPGYDCGTVLTYPSRGNQAFAQHQSCLVIKFELEEGECKTNYKRKGNDLILTVDMTLEEALLSRPIHLKTLDGRSINVNLDTMITPQTVHSIENEGMPKTDGSGCNGNLYIKFNILFPEKFKPQIKE